MKKKENSPPFRARLLLLLLTLLPCHAARFVQQREKRRTLSPRQLSPAAALHDAVGGARSPSRCRDVIRMFVFRFVSGSR